MSERPKIFSEIEGVSTVAMAAKVLMHFGNTIGPHDPSQFGYYEELVRAVLAQSRASQDFHALFALSQRIGDDMARLKKEWHVQNV